MDFLVYYCILDRCQPIKNCIVQLTISVYIFVNICLYYVLKMCVHTVQKNITIDRPEKLNWSENGIQDLLCESNYIEVDHQIEADTNDLNIIHLNIRSINSKTTELKYLIEKSLNGPPHDIIALCETWLTKDLLTPNIPGYDFIQKCRENKHGGGVALLISNHIRYKTLPDIQY